MLELEHGFRVVDVHARLDPDESDVATRGRDLSPERLEREMHQAGVVHAVVAPGRRERDESYLRANNAVARLSVDRSFSAFARLNGPRDPSPTTGAKLRNLAASRGDHHTSPGDVEQYAYDDRFHGFVLDPSADGLPDENVLDVLDDVGLPVVVHGSAGFPPSTVAETVLRRSFPVVLTSFGGFPLDFDRMETALELLGECDQLYLDTSAVRYRSLLERGLLEHPDRILFGSGAPTVHPNVAVMELLTLDVSEDAMVRAFSKNPARVVPSLAPGGR
ncbi:amidohydrolase family protein [Haloprofundus salinisoli]|uniref:amidohydrolase family protein n=1 Tax=Haloprofundus salinisoli TaxID=2876193 RepID=UPI001CCF7A47|nr:amidohydrolase family protein [Haloprofundus salinisoli]